MLQRHILYVAKTKFICYKDKFICYKDKKLYFIKTKFIYMQQRQNLYVAKTQKHGARAERARRGFFSPRKRHYYLLRRQ